MANLITMLRIICSFALLTYPVFSLQFYVLYLIAGFSDILDGGIARWTNTTSDLGSRLDTAADFIMATIGFIKIFPILAMKAWMYIWIGLIAIIKFINLLKGFIIQKKLIAIHSKLNKLTGAMLFILPLSLNFIELKYSISTVCIIASLAAIQEYFLC